MYRAMGPFFFLVFANSAELVQMQHLIRVFTVFLWKLL